MRERAPRTGVQVRRTTARAAMPIQVRALPVLLALVPPAVNEGKDLIRPAVVLVLS